MRRTALVVAFCYLQGCATQAVWNLATKGTEKSGMPLNASIESVWKDPNLQEYVLCINDSVTHQDKKRDRFTLKIPENLISSGESGLIEFKKWSVLELKPEDERHWWNGGNYRERESVRVYGLTLPVKYGCKVPKSNWRKLSVLSVPKDIQSNEAQLFQGDKLQQVLAKNEPFMVVDPSNAYEKSLMDNRDQAVQFSVCHDIDSVPCLILVSKTAPQNANNRYASSELLIPNELIWGNNPEPLWYLAVPFAVIADIVIISVAAIALGGMAGGR
jgi:hypothetical protein